MSELVPILEFDSDLEAIIEPTKAIKHRDFPQHVVLCFFREVVEMIQGRLGLDTLPPFKSEMGEIRAFVGSFAEVSIAIVPCPVGAPFAAGILEESIARGGRKFVVCGSAGVLDSDIASGGIIIPISAVRDEGTSYHYLPPTREVSPTELVLEAIRTTLDENHCPYRTGKTWTTDAIYRETRGKIVRRRQEGCISVEMEAAALFAVAQFRNVEIGMLLYGGDDVAGAEWDKREFGQKIPAREMLFWMALESCMKL